MPAQMLEAGLLGQLPEGLRGELLSTYAEILRNYREHRWEPSELNAGKLCEVIYSIISGSVAGKYPAKSTKPRNMVDACRALESAPSNFPRSVRVQIPRMLMALYEIRNNRGVGHVGGDVNPNRMDATCVLAMSKWLVAELIRVFHDVSIAQASAAVDTLVERTLPTVWEVGGKLRVLDPKMSMRDKTLLLLYKSQREVAETDLFNWVEHSNTTRYRADVLQRAHGSKLLEYDTRRRVAEISPLGIEYVEKHLL